MTVDDIRLVIADDHPVYRDGLARLLSAIGGFDVVGVAADGAEAVEIAASLAPDVVVMDIRMPNLDGIEATRRITAASPSTGVVVLSMFEEDELVFAAVRAGARGYLLKDADDDEIAAVLRGIARGEAIFGPTTARRLLDMLGRTPEQSEHTAPDPFPQLTQREQEVLEQLARGKRNAAIADELFLSERTVRNYVSNIFTKLQVADRAQAIAAARDAGIGKPPRHPPTV
ncbi:MAG: response regulator transcription factor [Actinobacteria bacterium]|nr:response regulator transcription factor [Actinomycetota bacterium]